MRKELAMMEVVTLHNKYQMPIIQLENWAHNRNVRRIQIEHWIVDSDYSKSSYLSIWFVALTYSKIKKSNKNFIRNISD